MYETKSKGFTLTELMIVVVVISVLAAIAYPSYLEQARDARRSDGQASLARLAQFMERFYTENNRYDQDLAGNAVALPFTQTPLDGTAAYNLTVAAAANTFTLSATPIVGGPQAGDGCGVMTLRPTRLPVTS